MEKKALKDIERSLIKTYRKHIFSKFVKAIKEYELVVDGDKIAIAISGGKDSIIMAKLFQELYNHGNRNFSLEFICMDPGYSPEHRASMEANLDYLGIPAKIFPSDIFAVSERIAGENPCYMCARMRRGFLYNKAQELGCNKLALGHHFDDVIETTLLNVLFAGCFKTMMPKLHSQNFENMQLIRPLYLIREEYIKRFMVSSGLQALDCACTVTSKESGGSKRVDVKELIALLADRYPNIENNIFKSAENVNLNGIIGWVDDDGKHIFTETYEE